MSAARAPLLARRLGGRRFGGIVRFGTATSVGATRGARARGRGTGLANRPA